MVDGSFVIDKICRDASVKLVRPPFSEKTAKHAKFASIRAHVNRTIRHIKTFKVLGDRMPVCLVEKSDQIITVICAMVNLSPPIVSDD